MKRRYVYVLLFSVPALLAALIVSMLFFGAAAGALWLFVLGDEPWPEWIGTLLVAILAVAGAALWLALLSIAYLAGKRQEAQATPDTRPAALAAGITALLLLLIVAQQWSVGRLGAKSDGQSCMDFCRAKGFSSSGTPPRNSGLSTCSCYDTQGRAALTVPIAEVTATPGR